MAAVPQRLLEVTFALGPSTDENKKQPTFTDSPGNNTVTLSGLRMSAKIVHAGGVSDGQLFLTVYGMARSQMLQLSTLGMKLNLLTKNQIVVTAGSSAAGMSTVFVGSIIQAEVDFNAQPNVCLRVIANCGAIQTFVPIPVSSFKGALDVATFMSSLAVTMGKLFENNGINVKLSNPYFTGSAMDQMKNCAKAAGINANIINGTLCIWPKNGSRDSGTMPLIAPPPQGGMIGYPTFSALGVNIRSLFNPAVGFGQKIQVKSSIEPADGIYTIYGLEYALESNVPDGKWEMLINAYNPKLPTTIIQQ